MSAPRAIAIGSPIIPVPGIPTPIAFFRMLALRKTVIFSGRRPNISVALAVHKATAIGSVQPTAGTTCSLMSLMMFSRVLISNIDELRILNVEF